jgi:hypothetical protein
MFNTIFPSKRLSRVFCNDNGIKLTDLGLYLDTCRTPVTPLLYRTCSAAMLLLKANPHRPTVWTLVFGEYALSGLGRHTT